MGAMKVLALLNRDGGTLKTTDLDWLIIRVTNQDTPGGVLGRLAAAWLRRTCDEGGKIA